MKGIIRDPALEQRRMKRVVRHSVWITCAIALRSPLAAQAGPCAVDTTHKRAEPFAFADFSWLNGNARTNDSPMAKPYFTGEFRADVSYIGDFNHPSDHTLVGTVGERPHQRGAGPAARASAATSTAAPCAAGS